MCFSLIYSLDFLLMQFSDNSSDMELRIQLGGVEIDSPKNISVNAEDTSLIVQIKQFGILRTLMEARSLYDKIKASETIWFVKLNVDQVF